MTSIIETFIQRLQCSFIKTLKTIPKSLCTLETVRVIELMIIFEVVICLKEGFNESLALTSR
jgi:hypothetical protein